VVSTNDGVFVAVTIHMYVHTYVRHTYVYLISHSQLVGILIYVTVSMCVNVTYLVSSPVHVLPSGVSAYPP